MTDIEIAKKTKLLPITEIAKSPSLKERQKGKK